MALGDGNYQSNNGGFKKSNEDSFYSRLVLSNPSGKYLKFKYWAGKLAISIAVGDSNGQKFQYKETATAFLSPLKAKVLANKVRELIADENHKPVGVVIGSGDPSTCLTFMHSPDGLTVHICKVDGTGNRSNEDTFVFQKDYQYSVTYKDFKKLDFVKEYDNDVEINSVIDLLEAFYAAGNGSIAYSVMDLSRYSFGRLKTNTEAIMDKLGIQRVSSKGPGFFNGNDGSGSVSSNTAEDIDDLL